MALAPFVYGTWRTFGTQAFAWGAMHFGVGNFNFSATDPLMLECAQNNVKVCLPIWGTPQWACVDADQTNGSRLSNGPWGLVSESAVPRFHSYVQEFLTAFLNKYPGQVAAVEGRNEPRPGNAWWYGNNVQLVAHQNAIYQAVKAVDSSIPVLAPSYFTGSDLLDFLSTQDPVSGKYGHQTFDLLTLHSYGAAPNKALSGTDLYFTPSLGPALANRLLAQAGGAPRGYAVTEWGISENAGALTNAFLALSAGERYTYICRILANAALNGCKLFCIFSYDILAGNYRDDTLGVMAAVREVHSKLAGKTIVNGGYLWDGRVTVSLATGESYTW